MAYFGFTQAGNDGIKISMHGLSGFLGGGSISMDGWVSEGNITVPSQPTYGPPLWGDRLLNPSDLGPEGLELSDPTQDSPEMEMLETTSPTQDHPDIYTFAGKFIVRR